MSFSLAGSVNLATRNSYIAGVDAAARATSVHALEVEAEQVLIDGESQNCTEEQVGQYKLGIKLRGWAAGTWVGVSTVRWYNPIPAVRGYGTVVLLWIMSLLAQYDRFVISFFSTEVRPRAAPVVPVC